MSAIGLPSCADRREDAIGVARRPGPAAREDHGAGLAARRRAHHEVRLQLLGRARAEFAVEGEELARALEREHRGARDDLALHRVQAELEVRHDAEVAAAAADGPVEVRVLVGVRVQQAAVGGHDVHALHVVERKAEAPREPAEAAAEREAADAGVRDRAAGRDEALRHRLVVDFAEEAPAIDVGALRFRVDAHAAKARQVDLHALLAGGLAGGAVAAALDREQQVAIAREAHRAHDVRDAGRLHDERRVHVDGFVQHAARRVVARIAGEEQGPAQARLEIGERRLLDDRGRAVELDGGEAARGLRRRLVERVEPRRRQRVRDGGGERVDWKK